MSQQSQKWIDSSISSPSSNIYSQQNLVDIYNKLNNENNLTIDSNAAIENSARASSLITPPSVEVLNELNSPSATSKTPLSPHSSQLTDPALISWYYTDLNGIQQGPFNSITMQSWYSQHLLNENLSVRRENDLNWLTISNLWDIIKSLNTTSINLSQSPFNIPLPVNLTITPPSLPPQLQHSLSSSLFNSFNTNNSTPILDDNNTQLNSRSNSNFNSTAASASSSAFTQLNPMNSAMSFNQLNNNFHQLNSLNSLNSIDSLNMNMNMNMNMLNYLNMDPLNSFMNPLMNSLNQMNNNFNQINPMNPLNQLDLDSRSNSHSLPDLSSHLNNQVDQLVPKSSLIDSINQPPVYKVNDSIDQINQQETTKPTNTQTKEKSSPVPVSETKPLQNVEQVAKKSVQDVKPTAIPEIKPTPVAEVKPVSIPESKPNKVVAPITPSIDLEEHMKSLEIEKKKKQKQELKLRQLQRQKEEKEQLERERLAKELAEKEAKETASNTTKSSKSDIAPWASVSKNIKPIKSLEEIQHEEKIKSEKEMENRKKLEESDRLLASKLALEDSVLPTINVNKKKVIPLNSLKPSNTLPTNSTWAVNGVSNFVTKSIDEIKLEQENEIAAAKHQKSIADAIASNQQYQPQQTDNSSTNAWTVVSKKEKPKSNPFSTSSSSSIPPQIKNTALNPSSLRSVSSPSTATTTYSAPTVPSVSSVSNFPPQVIEFLTWSRSQLSGLYSTVNKEDVLTIMLQLPIGSETTEIIADTVYSNSSTMDGRRFSKEFMTKRSKIEDLVNRRSWSFDWNEALRGTKNMKIQSSNVSNSSNAADDDWDGAFTVVKSKKGRKGN